jgi:hypothetical protein
MFLKAYKCQEFKNGETVTRLPVYPVTPSRLVPHSAHTRAHKVDFTTFRWIIGYFELGIDRRAVGVPDTGTVACHRLSVSVMVGMSEGPRPPSGLFHFILLDFSLFLYLVNLSCDSCLDMSAVAPPPPFPPHPSTLLTARRPASRCAA